MKRLISDIVFGLYGSGAGRPARAFMDRFLRAYGARVARAPVNEAASESTAEITGTYAAATVQHPDSYLKAAREVAWPLAQPLAAYGAFIDHLVEHDVSIQPLFEFAQQLEGDRPEGVTLGLRHDIDADPATAVRMARLLARRGVCGSFYLLHTAAWYGVEHGGLFVRSPMLRGWVRALIASGCEIGLHNDTIGAFFSGLCDGHETLIAELAWLRNEGAVVEGTVAHNSIGVNGAENYEVFAGHLLWDRELYRSNGARAPLGAVEPVSLGLRYEGAFAKPKARFDREAAEAFASRSDADIRDESWMRMYLLENPCCDWLIDVQVWVVGADSWVVGGRLPDSGEAVFHWNVTGAEAARIISELPSGTRALAVLHPIYFSRDAHALNERDRLCPLPEEVLP